MQKRSSLFFVLTAIVLMLVSLTACGDLCNHTLVFREGVAAQCEKDGTLAHYECTLCGALFADEEATQKLTKSEITVKAPGHVYTTGSNCDVCGAPCPHLNRDGDGVCTACGAACPHEHYTDGRCDECGHACTHEENGQKLWADGVCTVCGASCTHVWDKESGQCTVCGVLCAHPECEEEVISANCLEGSTVTRTCKTCGHVEQEVFPARDSHEYDYEEGTHVEGDCAHKGYTVYRCKYCEAEETAEDGEYGPHKYEPQAEKESYVCTVCGNACYHESYRDGFCTECHKPCKHDWAQGDDGAGGVCTVCGMQCRHEGNSGCVCTVCGFQFRAHRFTSDGVCVYCGAVHEHRWGHDGFCVGGMNGNDEGCGFLFLCAHETCSYTVYVDEEGKQQDNRQGDRYPHEDGHCCLTCGQILSHNFVNGVCEDCGYKCEHSWEWTGGPDEDPFEFCYKCGMGCDHVSHYADPEGTCTVCHTRVGHTMSEDHRCTSCNYVCTHSFHDALGNCSVCGKHVGHQFEEDANNGTRVCTVCSYRCFHLAADFRKGEPCSVCGAKCPHYMDETDTCVLCKFHCTHEAWESGRCKVCGKECAHETHTQDGKCPVCGSACRHGPYKDGQCTVCGKKCDHDWDDRGGTCFICGMACTHEYGEDKYCHICGMGLEHWHTFIYGGDGICTEEGCNYHCRHRNWGTTGVCNDCGYQCEHDWQYEVSSGSGISTCRLCGTYCEHSSYYDTSWMFMDGVCMTCGWKCTHTYNDPNAEQFGGYDPAVQHRCGFCGHLEDHSWVDDGSGEDMVCSVCHRYCDHGRQVGEDFYGSKFEDGVCTVCGWECDHGPHSNHIGSFMGWVSDTGFDTEDRLTHRCDLCGMEQEHRWTSDADTHSCEICHIDRESHDFSMGTGACMRCGYQCKHPRVSNGYCEVCGMELSSAMLFPLGDSAVSLAGSSSLPADIPSDLPPRREQA